jgi:hypothetical protein
MTGPTLLRLRATRQKNHKNKKPENHDTPSLTRQIAQGSAFSRKRSHHSTRSPPLAEKDSTRVIL